MQVYTRRVSAEYGREHETIGYRAAGGARSITDGVGWDMSSMYSGEDCTQRRVGVTRKKCEEERVMQARKSRLQGPNNLALKARATRRIHVGVHVGQALSRVDPCPLICAEIRQNGASFGLQGVEGWERWKNVSDTSPGGKGSKGVARAFLNRLKHEDSLAYVFVYARQQRAE
jgi:hypothetical protein